MKFGGIRNKRGQVALEIGIVSGEEESGFGCDPMWHGSVAWFGHFLVGSYMEVND
jgi:hypothetical protein